VGEDGLLVSAIVVSYNTREMTLQCLRALQADLAGVPSDIWLVDNASSDGSVVAVGREFPDVHVIRNLQNVGFGAANNQALRQAKGEFYLLVNSDAFLRPGAVAALLACARAHPEAAVVGPRLLNPDGSLQMSCYRFPSPARAFFESFLLTAAMPNHPVFGDYRAWPHDSERDVGFVIGACIFVRRSAAEVVGFFDESFFLYAEETDWCMRFRRAGWRVLFTPDARVVHVNRGSGERQSDRTFCEFRRGQERLFRKHYGLWGLCVLRGCTVAGALLRIAAFGLAALASGAKRKRYLAVAADWRRILLWTIGFRGPGLSESGEGR